MRVKNSMNFIGLFRNLSARYLQDLVLRDFVEVSGFALAEVVETAVHSMAVAVASAFSEVEASCVSASAFSVRQPASRS